MKTMKRRGRGANQRVIEQFFEEHGRLPNVSEMMQADPSLANKAAANALYHYRAKQKAAARTNRRKPANGKLSVAPGSALDRLMTPAATPPKGPGLAKTDDERWLVAMTKLVGVARAKELVDHETKVIANEIAQLGGTRKVGAA